MFQLAVSTLPIKETDSGLWPTPTAMTGGTGVAPSHKDGSHGWNIGAAVNDSLSENPNRMWPTPLAQEAKHGTVTDWEMTTDHAGTKGSLRVAAVKSMWPTPATRDHKGGYQGGRIRNGKVSWDSLDVAVQHTDNQEKTGGQLNPMFVEWLMGYPEGWTDLKD